MQRWFGQHNEGSSSNGVVVGSQPNDLPGNDEVRNAFLSNKCYDIIPNSSKV